MLLTRHQFTADDYHRMRTAGIFAADDRLELLDGEIIRMSPIGPLHASIVRRLHALLRHMHLNQWIVSVRDPIQLSDLSEPQPDIALLHYRADYYATSHPQPSDIALLIEVSDSSLEYDRAHKLPRYAASGIPEVWIVATEQQYVEQYFHPAHGIYRTKQVWVHGETITSHALPTVSIALEAILG